MSAIDQKSYQISFNLTREQVLHIFRLEISSDSPNSQKCPLFINLQSFLHLTIRILCLFMTCWQSHYNFLNNLGRMLIHHIICNSNAVCTMPKKWSVFIAVLYPADVYKHTSIIYQILERKKNKNYTHKTKKGMRWCTSEQQEIKFPALLPLRTLEKKKLKNIA